MAWDAETSRGEKLLWVIGAAHRENLCQAAFWIPRLLGTCLPPSSDSENLQKKSLLASPGWLTAGPPVSTDLIFKIAAVTRLGN